MKNVFIINAHLHYPFSEGKLSSAIIQAMETYLLEKGYQVKHTKADTPDSPDAEMEKHLWADTIIIQTPINWMGFPWTMKKYIDEVYLGGDDGVLYNGDGRTRSDSNCQYGTGGVRTHGKYMLSTTANAPTDAFNDPKQYLLQGKGLDDLLLPIHATYRFFGMTAIPTFACYDVIKKSDDERLADFHRLDEHMKKYF